MQWSSCLLWAALLLLLPTATANYQEISIRLLPRDHVDPRSADNFTCGVDTSIDPVRLIAEQNVAYLFDVFDNTNDKSKQHQTEVFDVISFDRAGTAHQMTDGEKFENQTGVFTLFLAPSMHQCNAQSFDDSLAEGGGYFPVFVGSSNVFNETLVLNKFKTDATVLKRHFQPKEKLPKLCGSFSPMQFLDEVAVSSTKSLVEVFNFLYNEGRDPASFNPSIDTNCRTPEETEQSLGKNFNSDGASFEETEFEARETDGFLKVDLQREPTPKKAAVLIETIDGTADKTDFVRFKGPAIFAANSNTTSFYIRLKYDKDTSDETFTLKIKTAKKREKRGGKLSQGIILGEQFYGLVTGKCEPERKNIPLGEWTKAIVNSLTGRNIRDKQHFLITYADYEMPLGSRYKEVEQKRRLPGETNKKMEDRIIAAYKEMVPSCHKTAAGLHSLYNEGKKIHNCPKLSPRRDDMGELITSTPIQDFEWGWQIIMDALNVGKVVGVEFRLPGTPNNHFITIWIDDKSYFNLVHGFQGKFFFERTKMSKEGGLRLLKRLLEPRLEPEIKDPNKADQAKERANMLKRAMRDLFGQDICNHYADIKEWSEPWDVFYMRQITTGFPSALMPSLKDACKHSPIYQKYRDNMPETKKVCG